MRSGEVTTQVKRLAPRQNREQGVRYRLFRTGAATLLLCGSFALPRTAEAAKVAFQPVARSGQCLAARGEAALRPGALLLVAPCQAAGLTTQFELDPATKKLQFAADRSLCVAMGTRTVSTGSWRRSSRQVPSLVVQPCFSTAVSSFDLSASLLRLSAYGGTCVRADGALVPNCHPNDPAMRWHQVDLEQPPSTQPTSIPGGEASESAKQTVQVESMIMGGGRCLVVPPGWPVRAGVGPRMMTCSTPKATVDFLHDEQSGQLRFDSQPGLCLGKNGEAGGQGQLTILPCASAFAGRFELRDGRLQYTAHGATQCVNSRLEFQAECGENDQWRISRTAEVRGRKVQIKSSVQQHLCLGTPVGAPLRANTPLVAQPCTAAPRSVQFTYDARDRLIRFSDDLDLCVHKPGPTTQPGRLVVASCGGAMSFNHRDGRLETRTVRPLCLNLSGSVTPDCRANAPELQWLLPAP